jgi:hypothetical protein
MAKVKLSKLQQAYREFFKALMDEYGVKSPVELKDKRSEFFNRIKKEWPAAKKKIKEGVLRQEIRDVIVEVLEEKKSLNEARHKRTTFGDLEIGDEFYFEPEQRADKWVKKSTKTVQQFPKGRVFAASKDDMVYTLE